MATAGTAVSLAGLVLACLSMVGNGTFAIFKNFCHPPPDDVLFSSYTSVGVLLSSVVAVFFAPGGDLGWTWSGALGGVLLVCAIVNSFIAISLSGLATAQATWSCAAIVVSVLWGVLGPRRDGAGPGAPTKTPALTGVAVALLVAGVLVINLKEQLAALICRRKVRELDVETETELATANKKAACGDIDGAGTQPSVDAPSSEDDRGTPGSSERPSSRSGSSREEKGGLAAAIGVLPALLVGVSGGSVLVPMSFVEPRLHGLPVLLSFGVAGGVAGIAVGVAYWKAVRRESFSLAPNSALRGELRPTAVLMGILSGIVWNLGNICQIVAMAYLKMPYGISYPILQCAFIVGGLWGIFLFKEVKEREQVAVFFGGVAIVVGGVVLLGMHGPGA